ncbi:MAG: hypothetical protein M0R80_26135 [Proteobacteria bacterium]|nr:hypothetical protein [Pseudomonadota bacterium]
MNGEPGDGAIGNSSQEPDSISTMNRKNLRSYCRTQEKIVFRAHMEIADLRALLSALVEAAEVLRSKYCETCERIGCGKTEEHCPQVKAVVDAINREKGVE